METLWFLSGEVGIMFSSGQNKIHSHNILNIFLFEMTFQVSSHNDIMFSGTISPKLLKSAKVSTTGNKILVKENLKQLWLSSA